MLMDIHVMCPVSAVAVAVALGLYPRHEGEADHDGESAEQARHAVLGQLVPGQHLEEGDVEQSPSGQTLQHADDEDVLP